MAARSSSEISKPLTSTFSTSRSFLTLLGSVIMLFCRDHLTGAQSASRVYQDGHRATHLTNSCAGVHSYALARLTILGCLIRMALASGAYASTLMSCLAQVSRMEVCVLKGCTSIWLITGCTFGPDATSSSICPTGHRVSHTSTTRQSMFAPPSSCHLHTPGGYTLTCLTPKLLTPAILTSPAPTASSRARQLVRRASFPP